MTEEGETKIRKLDQATVERIAAGEVVERPASVVKELVENSLDADASRIEVAVDGDGTDRIRVSDDGTGMTEADLRAAVREHTTSKIGDIDDLESGVETLGFRGEALHTIGAVSRTTITTKARGGTRGTRLEYEGGEVTAVEPAGCPEGTTVEVEDLFFNTPARRKYLKREATEFAHVNRVASRYALANPDVAVSLEHDGRETFSTAGQGSLQAAILSVYGREVAEGMLPVAEGEPPEIAADLPEAGDDLESGPLTGIAGYASHPETTRSNADYVSTFVNGRYVTSSTVRDAVLEAYGGQLAADRYPFAVLHLALPAESVDVNVHPRKMEVRFGDADGVRRQVRQAVRGALLEHGLIRTGAPRGKSAPDETPVAPGSEVESDAGAERTDGSDAGRTDASGRAAETTEESTGTGDGSALAASESAERTDGSDDGRDRTDVTGSPNDSQRETSDGRTASDRGGSTAGELGGSTAEEPGESTGDERDAPPSDGSATGSQAETTTGTTGAVGAADSGSSSDGDRTVPGADSRGNGQGTDGKFSGLTEQRTLEGDRAAPEAAYDSLPWMRILGQYDETYLVAETESGLALVDQHAADERVNYERLVAAFEDGTTSQQLADPVELELTAGETATFEAARDALSELGFEADLVASEDDHRRRLQVQAVPAVFDATLSPERLTDVLDAVVGGDPGETVEELADEFLADLACYPSITGNTSLTEGSVTELLDALDDCENPYACPHGRPVVIELDRTEIEDRFERDYPGHGPH
jgi:DNA mismatch repair protein MutL